MLIWSVNIRSVFNFLIWVDLTQDLFNGIWIRNRVWRRILTLRLVLFKLSLRLFLRLFSIYDMTKVDIREFSVILLLDLDWVRMLDLVQILDWVRMLDFYQVLDLVQILD